MEYIPSEREFLLTTDSLVPDVFVQLVSHRLQAEMEEGDDDDHERVVTKGAHKGFNISHGFLVEVMHVVNNAIPLPSMYYANQCLSRFLSKAEPVFSKSRKPWEVDCTTSESEYEESSDEDSVEDDNGDTASADSQDNDGIDLVSEGEMPSSEDPGAAQSIASGASEAKHDAAPPNVPHLPPTLDTSIQLLTTTLEQSDALEVLSPGQFESLIALCTAVQMNLRESCTSSKRKLQEVQLECAIEKRQRVAAEAQVGTLAAESEQAQAQQAALNRQLVELQAEGERKDHKLATAKMLIRELEIL